MNRRQFLIGIAGSAAVVSIPSAILDVVAAQNWKAAIDKVIQEYMTEFVVYGTAGLTQCKDFPFIRCVSVKELLNIPEIYRSTGEY